MIMMILMTMLLVVLHPTQIQSNDDFNKYVERFQKQYEIGSEEYKYHEQIYDSTLKHIQQHNQLPNQYYQQGVNQFTDQTPSNIFKGYQSSKSSQSSQSSSRTLTQLPFTLDDIQDLPTHIDWRLHNIVSPVKDQGSCGSCWAFATTEIVESSVALHTSQLLELSPQQLVDCVENVQECGGTGGCAGATVELGLEYILQSGGMVLEQSLEYLAKDDRCPYYDHQQYDYQQYDYQHDYHDQMTKTHLRRLFKDSEHPTTTNNNNPNPVASIEGFVTLPTNDYQAVMNAIAKMGPIAVAVDASHWYLYDSGIYTGNPDGTFESDIDHAVVLVGYGTDDETGLDYWLVRNSWGPHWGEDGYIRLLRNAETAQTVETHCAMDTKPLDGSGCALDKNGATVLPKPVLVCALDGILFDVVVPLGGYLV